MNMYLNDGKEAADNELDWDVNWVYDKGMDDEGGEDLVSWSWVNGKTAVDKVIEKSLKNNELLHGSKLCKENTATMKVMNFKLND